MYPFNQETTGPDQDQRTRGPKGLWTREIGTKGQKDQGTRAPKDQWTSGLKDQRTRGLADHRARRAAEEAYPGIFLFDSHFCFFDHLFCLRIFLLFLI